MAARILLVEDNEMNRDMLSRRLQPRGYEVLTAVDGDGARNRGAGGGPPQPVRDGGALALPAGVKQCVLG